MPRWLPLLLLLACDKKPPPAPVVVDAAIVPVAVTVPDAAPIADKPTTVDCQAAVARMRTLSAAAVASDQAADVADCLQMPRPIVLCLAGAASMDAAEQCVGAARSGPEAVPPEPRASPADCARLGKHYHGLLGAPGDEKAEASMLAACRAELTQSDVECVLAARSRDDAEACLSL
jgi:hypothetical protein